jgi:hypothetical protein
MPSLVVSFVALLALVATASARPAAPQRCVAAKLAAAGTGAAHLMRCLATGQAKGTATSTECAIRAGVTLSAGFAKAETKGSCVPTDDANPAWAIVGTFAVPAAQSLGTPGANRCAAAKVRAAGAQFAQRVRCHAGAVRRGGPVDAGCLAQGEHRLEAAFARAEAAGGCATAGDAAAIEAAADTQVAILVALLWSVPTTTTTVTTTSTAPPTAVSTTSTVSTIPAVPCTEWGASCGCGGNGVCLDAAGGLACVDRTTCTVPPYPGCAVSTGHCTDGTICAGLAGFGASFKCCATCR